MSDPPQSLPSLKHELRTPLNHIIGFCEMLIEEAGDGADQASGSAALVPDLHRIHAAGRRLLGVINDLFDPSIPGSERLDEARIHHEVRTPLNQIIGYTELLREEAAEMGDGPLIADLGKIHAAAHRLLELALANFGSTGFRADHGGRPDADRPVPLLQGAAPAPGDPEPAPGRPSHRTGSILIADDDAANREMLARRLERLGHTVSTAANGREAVEMIRDRNYDLLLLDIVMPGLSGHQVLAHLRAEPPAAALPVIVLSASDDSGSVARCITMGAEDYLPKPFDPVLLQARIDSCLEKKHLRDREAMHLQAIEAEKKRSDDLLHVILPDDIAAELMASGEVRPRRVENVAVLFADVVGFTSYCERTDPETVHRDLQSLVRAMEALTAAHGMEKVKTIGDAFLSAAGLIHQVGNPALDCVRCGLAMIDRVARLPVKWQLRVGMHVGPVVAGIVGRKRYQYDIWGDTVNAAARMQAEARPGTLCVTGQTWRILRPSCRGRHLGRREVKGKGQLDVFEVTAIATDG